MASSKSRISALEKECEEYSLLLENSRLELVAAKSEAEKCRRMAARALDFSQKFDAVIGEPFKPVKISKPSKKSTKTPHTAVLHISDVHCGEVVSFGQMNGLNSYNKDICRKRMERLFKKTSDLLLNHSGNDIPEKLVIILGGDMISGEIHDELSKSNDLTAVQSTKVVGELISGGIAYLLSELKIPIDIHCVPGNHGRLERKPEVKGEALNSFDILACQFAEAFLQKQSGLEWFYPESGEARFNIYGTQCLALHGHNIGASGGTGFIGAEYPIIRGQVKTAANYDSRRDPVRVIFSGHLHTTLRARYGYSNGSLIGPSEYSANKLKAFPESARQNLVVFAKGYDWPVLHREIQVGSPDEGSIYRNVKRA